MKISNFNFIHRAIAGSLMLLATAFSVYGNTTETVDQAKGTVSLTADVDYVITSATPFASAYARNQDAVLRRQRAWWTW